ncbi:MAG: NAD-dependent epimerase/dehydratase family protein, partial [Candidatus Falkowbacteria bacterium]|nr:NAD-dependent epimerase/dehydratase family protein [Candidatus Falkowbacteria bacterium]
KQNAIVTFNILECMRLTGVKKIIFASTSAIYGEAKIKPTPEDYGPLFPISLYGAGKLASEALIAAFCHIFNFQAWIFRFANIVGRNGTHGAIFDFIKKLRNDPSRLDVLGDGKQSKPYLHVRDCIDGMIYGLLNTKAQINFFNLSCDGSTSVKFIANEVVKKINPAARIVYSGGKGGWVGDVPKVRLDTEKMKSIGWSPKNSSNQAVMKAVEELVKQI